MFDFTSEIKLEKKEQKIYARWRALLYVVAIASAFYTAYLVFFPTAYFTFSFLNPDSTKNTLVTPRGAEGALPSHGNVEKNSNLTFDAGLVGNYSKAVVEITLAKKSAPLTTGSLTLKKGFQDYFYPEGEETDYQPKTDANGVADGTLAVYGDSVYILSKGFFYPVDSIETFLAQGYNWNDLQQLGPDVIATFKKDKLFTLKSPHPDGTVLKADNEKSYLIEAGKKIPLSQASLENLPKRSAIAVSAKSLTVLENCDLKKNMLNQKTYSCEIPLEKIKDFLGVDYQFSAQFAENIKIDTLNVQFKKEVSWESLKNTLLEILRRVKNNYNPNAQ